MPIKHAIQDKIQQIDSCLTELSYTNDSLLTGNAGVCIYLAHHSRTFKLESSHYRLNDNLESILSHFETSNMLPTFCNGFTGLSWTMAYLNKNEFIDLDTQIFFSEIEKLIYQFSISCLKKKQFDFMHEGLGAALYFIESLPSPFSNQSLEKIILQLYANIQNETIWKTYQTNDQGITEEINFGLSHGIPSIIAVLTQCFSSGIRKDLCQKMIIESVNFLQKSTKTSGCNSLFPIFIKNNEWIGPSRLAWCYGDLGVASSIWQASKSLNREDWKQEAINILLHNCKRRDLIENNVVDATLCHGTAGIAHIFNRFYKETGIKEFDDARWYWLEQTFKMAKWEDGLAGYKVWQGERGWQNEYGLLEGIAGIGLALLGFLTDDVNDLCWDRCLLLS